MHTKGIIALDIDGTITEEFHSVPSEVVGFLEALAVEGWQIFFVTGRSYTWGLSLLKAFKFPYTLAVQNGAIMLQMPDKKLLAKKYLDKSIFKAMDEVCCDEASDYVIYTGYEHGDVCYFRPTRFSPSLLDYLKARYQALGEVYQPILSYQALPVQVFPSIKCFGCPDDAARIAAKMEHALGLHVTPISDPFNGQMMVAQATHPEVSKGRAVEEMRAISGKDILVIAAGNDYNDESMFAVSDIKVVMGNAPTDLIELADIVAPPVSEMGIITGLREAFRSLS